MTCTDKKKFNLIADYWSYNVFVKKVCVQWKVSPKLNKRQLFWMGLQDPLLKHGHFAAKQSQCILHRVFCLCSLSPIWWTIFRECDCSKEGLLNKAFIFNFCFCFLLRKLVFHVSKTVGWIRIEHVKRRWYPALCVASCAGLCGRPCDSGTTLPINKTGVDTLLLCQISIISCKCFNFIVIYVLCSWPFCDNNANKKHVYKHIFRVCVYMFIWSVLCLSLLPKAVFWLGGS